MGELSVAASLAGLSPAGGSSRAVPVNVERPSVSATLPASMRPSPTATSALAASGAAGRSPPLDRRGRVDRRHPGRRPPRRVGQERDAARESGGRQPAVDLQVRAAGSVALQRERLGAGAADPDMRGEIGECLAGPGRGVDLRLDRRRQRRRRRQDRLPDRCQRRQLRRRWRFARVGWRAGEAIEIERLGREVEIDAWARAEVGRAGGGERQPLVLAAEAQLAAVERGPAGIGHERAAQGPRHRRAGALVESAGDDDAAIETLAHAAAARARQRQRAVEIESGVVGIAGHIEPDAGASLARRRRGKPEAGGMAPPAPRCRRP